MLWLRHFYLWVDFVSHFLCNYKQRETKIEPHTNTLTQISFFFVFSFLFPSFLYFVQKKLMKLQPFLSKSQRPD